jgi:hypothetical protein
MSTHEGNQNLIKRAALSQWESLKNAVCWSGGFHVELAFVSATPNFKS